MPGKGKCRIDIDMLQLQRGTSLLQLSKLEACQRRDAKGKVAENTQDCNRKGVLLKPHHPRTVLQVP
jgi:hypothetical protein